MRGDIPLPVSEIPTIICSLYFIFIYLFFIVSLYAIYNSFLFSYIYFTYIRNILFDYNIYFTILTCKLYCIAYQVIKDLVES